MRCVKEEQKGELKRTLKEPHMGGWWGGGAGWLCEAGRRTRLMPST